MDFIVNITNATVLTDSFLQCEASTLASMTLAVLFIFSEVMPFIGDKSHNNSIIQFIHEICSCQTKCKKKKKKKKTKLEIKQEIEEQILEEGLKYPPFKEITL